MKFTLMFLFLFSFSLSAIAHQKNVKPLPQDTLLAKDKLESKKKQFTLPMFFIQRVEKKSEE